jgi:hypothetical protein
MPAAIYAARMGPPLRSSPGWFPVGTVAAELEFYANLPINHNKQPPVYVARLSTIFRELQTKNCLLTV